MQLLALDRSARPQSAAEVMERLCAIAGLPMQERARGLARVPDDADAGRPRQGAARGAPPHALARARRRRHAADRRRGGLGPLAHARRVRARGQAARRGRAARRRRRRRGRRLGRGTRADGTQLLELLPRASRGRRAACRATCWPRDRRRCASSARRQLRCDARAQLAACASCATSCWRCARAAPAAGDRRRRPHRRTVGRAARRARAQDRDAQR